MRFILLSVILLFGSIYVGYTQNVVINEFGSLNSKIFDEDNDTPDWIELYNSSDSAVNLLDFTLTDDSLVPGKWAFPNLELAANNVLFLFASGKDRNEMIYYRNLITQGDEFAYSIGTDTISSNWKTANYDASSWPSGLSGFGYGDNDDATEVPTYTLSVFIRKSFTVSDISKIKEVVLHMDYDDGFVAYINGVEIARENLGTVNTDVPYNQTADTYTEPLMAQGLAPTKYTLSNISDFLVEGENILAIQVHNNSTTSSDLTLIPFLSLGYTAPSTEGNTIPDAISLDDKSLHTNFKITADGENIYLFDNNGTRLDCTDSIPLPTDISYGRSGSNINKWVYFSKPTPGALNTTTGYDSISSEAVVFSLPGGKYSSSIMVALSCASGADIYYTTDGTDPDESSTKYINGFTVSKSQTIKAITSDSALLMLYPSVQTYIIESRDFNLPIFSISTDPYNLFDYNYGILETGPNAETADPHYGANYWMDWERPVHLEYFDKDGNKLFETNAGTKVFGAYSRMNAQKSMAFYARKAYGAKSFKYPFFEERNIEKYKSFIIRNSGNDWAYTAFRDAMMTHLLEGVDIDYQAYQPVIIYINGEYWGILNMREKINEDYLENNHPSVDADNVDILEGNTDVVEGSAYHYNLMMDYIQSNDMASSVVYDSVCQLMDIDNFMEYMLAEIYFDNTDWPGNNIKYWRPQTATGKWRWLLFDTDFGFSLYNLYNYQNNTLEFATATDGASWPNPPWSTLLLRSLLKNSTFEHDFINRFADRINTNFEPTRVVNIIDSLESRINDEIPYHIAKWNHMYDYEGSVQNMLAFAQYRPTYMRSYIKSFFSLKALVNLTVDTDNKSMGTVNVNILTLTDFPWTGKYFNGNSVTISAVAKPGYDFDHWDGSESTSSELEIDIPSGGLSLKAYFKPTTKDYNNIVVNEINYKSSDEYDTSDWFEINNTSETDLDISGWKVFDYGNESFTIPNGTIIGKKAYLVICKDLEKFNEVYPNISNAIGNFDFGLSSTYDLIKICDLNNTVVDSVLYQSENPWPVIDDGQTISLISPYSDNSVGSSWDASLTHGTPGANNDYFTSNAAKKVNENQVLISCFPNPSNDFTTIRWSNTEVQNTQIIVYDLQGQIIKSIFQNECPAGTFEETWQTTQNKPGIYFIKISFENGLTKTLKYIKL